MEESVLSLIQYHLNLIDSVSHISKQILLATKEANVEQANAGAENRQRLLNLMGMIQIKTDQILQESNRRTSEHLSEVLKLWAYDFNLWATEINRIDEEITDNLSLLKDQTTQELGHLFQNKEKFKGYNLNNLKK
ncbi:MAG: hypothetical protein WCG27_05345 [Pseudomonadota bacterium]